MLPICTSINKNFEIYCFTWKYSRINQFEPSRKQPEAKMDENIISTLRNPSTSQVHVWNVRNVFLFCFNGNFPYLSLFSLHFCLNIKLNKWKKFYYYFFFFFLYFNKVLFININWTFTSHKMALFIHSITLFSVFTVLHYQKLTGSTGVARVRSNTKHR